MSSGVSSGQSSGDPVPNGKGEKSFAKCLKNY